MHHYSILCLFFTLVIQFSAAQNNPVTCQEDSLYQKLDFWIGEWEVYDESGENLQGYNTIAYDLAGCTVTEFWEGTGGGIGKSLFYVDNKEKTWKQVWVTTYSTQAGGQKEKTMVSSKSDEVVFQGHYPYDTLTVNDRTILSLLPNGDVRQEIQTSLDGGTTWKTGFVGIYKKKE